MASIQLYCLSQADWHWIQSIFRLIEFQLRCSFNGRCVSPRFSILIPGERFNIKQSIEYLLGGKSFHGRAELVEARFRRTKTAHCRGNIDKLKTIKFYAQTTNRKMKVINCDLLTIFSFLFAHFIGCSWWVMCVCRWWVVSSSCLLWRANRWYGKIHIAGSFYSRPWNIICCPNNVV